MAILAARRSSSRGRVLSPLRVVVVGSCAIAAGCTFTGIGRYDIPRCNAPKSPLSLAEDPCNALNQGDGCAPYQCDAVTGTCVERPLDFDRDGDPSPRCGGRDCDDRDGRRASALSEICDGIDNDCSGIADDDLVEPLAPTSLLAGAFADATLSSSNGADTIGAAAVKNPRGGTCIVAFRASGEAINAPCTFLSRPQDLDPRQPWVRPVAASDPTLGAVFVDVGATCAAGRIAFRNTKDVGFEDVCLTAGESLPAFMPYPSGDVAVTAYLRTSHASRADAVSACAGASAAPLDVAWIERIASLDPAPHVYAQHLALATSFAMRPPALVPRGDGVLLAAPAGTSAALWVLRAPKPDGSGESIIPLLTPSSLPMLAGARAASAALATIDGVDHVAIAAEIGCAPSQRIVLAIARLEDPGPVATVIRDVEIASARGLATDPRVAWLDGRREWWTSWIGESAPGARAMFVRAASVDAAHVGREAHAGDRVLSTCPRRETTGASVSVAFLDETGLAEARFGCP